MHCCIKSRVFRIQTKVTTMGIQEPMGIQELLNAATRVVVDDKEIEELLVRLQAAEKIFETKNLARSANKNFMSRTYCL